MSSSPSWLERWQMRINDLIEAIDCLARVVRSVSHLIRNLTGLFLSVGSLLEVARLTLHHC